MVHRVRAKSAGQVNNRLADILETVVVVNEPAKPESNFKLLNITYRETWNILSSGLRKLCRQTVGDQHCRIRPTRISKRQCPRLWTS